MAWPDTTVGQFAEVQFQSTYASGQKVRNTMHVWGHDSASPMEVADIEGFLSSSWMDGVITAYRALLGTDDTLDGVLMRQVFDPLNPDDVKNEGFRSVALGGSGAFTHDAPDEITSILKFGTDAAGRSAHGRWFTVWGRTKGSFSGDFFLNTGHPKVQIDALVVELAKLFYTSGSHATGGAVDFDLAIYSPTRRKDNQPQYGYRVTSLLWDRRVRFLRSRGVRG